MLRWEAENDVGPTGPKKQYEEQLLFLGKQQGFLNLEAHVVELDKNVNLQKASGALSAAAGVGGALGERLLGPVFNFISSLVDFFRQKKDNDLELLFSGSLGGPETSFPLKTGAYEIVRKGAQGGDDLILGLQILKYDPPSNDLAQEGEAASGKLANASSDVKVAIAVQEL